MQNHKNKLSPSINWILILSNHKIAEIILKIVPVNFLVSSRFCMKGIKNDCTNTIRLNKCKMNLFEKCLYYKETICT